ncbi:MAG: cupin-like domain-containing protein [Dokdonia sp.]|jgi:hypothetical protein
MHSFLDKVKNYTPGLPSRGYGWLEFKWSFFFLLDFTFDLLDKKDADGMVKKKQDINSYWGRTFKKMHDKTAKKIMAKNPIYTQPFSLPTIDAKDFDKAFFDAWKKHIDQPIVVKGYLKDAPIMSYAEKDNLIKAKGDLAVKHLSTKKISEDLNKVGQNITLDSTTLKEYLTNPEYEQSYLNNFYGVLNDADFTEKCKGSQIDAIHGKSNMITQWFIARSNKTGSTLHCAGGYNMFLNIKGQKEWYFVDPSYTTIMQPAMSKYAHYTVSELFENHEGDFFSQIRSDYPELKHVPIFRYVLEEGDMLINPSHWWHRVMNLTDYTVGCATRYKLLEKTGVNFTYMACIIIDAIKHPKQSVLFKVWNINNNEKKKKRFIDGIFSAKAKKAS